MSWRTQARRTCASCGAMILFRSTPSGETMPLDERARETARVGMYVIVDDEHCRPAAPMFDEPGTLYHSCHFDTCPNADEHRRR